MHYLRDGLHAPRLGWIYALVAGVAALTTTPFTQPNSMAVVLESQFGMPTWVSGALVAVLAWLVIIGGIRSIGRAAEKLAPLKVGLYLAGGLWVILFHARAASPSVFALIFREAFSVGALVGGTAGAGMMVAMRYGLARGIYANEAGYGTAAVAYGTARSEQPRPAGAERGDGGLHRLLRHLLISALTILVSGVWRSGPHQHGRGGPRLRHRDPASAGGSWPSARSSSATPRSSAGPTTASSSSSTSSGRGSSCPTAGSTAG